MLTNPAPPQAAPPPVEWSSDQTARMVTRLAADVTTIRKWVTFFGVLVVLWVIVAGLILMITIGALSNS